MSLFNFIPHDMQTVESTHQMIGSKMSSGELTSPIVAESMNS